MDFSVEWLRMVSNARMSPEYLKAKKEAKNSGAEVPEPDGLDLAYVYDNENLRFLLKNLM